MLDKLRNERLPPIVLQVAGLIGLLACGVFWAVTNRLEPSLLAAAGSLIGIGQYVGAVKTLTQGPSDSPPPVAKSTEHDVSKPA